jgi:hypothetical protein
MRNVDRARQPNRSKVYSAWIKAFTYNIPGAVEHLADVIEDTYNYELWKDNFLDTPEQFFDRMGILGLDLESPAKLIKELRKKRSSVKAKIIARAEEAKALHEQGLTQRQIAEKQERSLGAVNADLNRNECSENTGYTPKTEQKRKKLQINISQYTTPATAATKIRAVFGDGFANQLKAEL